MKTPFLTALKGLAFLVLILLTGCQKEELSAPNGMITSRVPSCTAPAGDPVITYSANPTSVGVPVTVTFNANNGASCGNVQIQQLDPSPDVTWDQVATGTPTLGLLTYTFTPTVVGTYQFRGKYTGSGPGCTFCNNPSSGGFYEAPVDLEVTGCSIEGNTFTGTADAGSCDETRGATYTLCSEDGLDYFKIQGGLTNFTGADAVIVVTGGVGVTSGQHTPGNSTNRIITVEGGLDECSCVTVYVTWNSTNTGGTITGAWSAKDHVDLIPGTAYVAELSCIE